MTINSIVGATPDLVGLAMDVNSLRQAVTAHNIANVNTPGFQASKVDFSAAMERLQQAPARVGGRSDTASGFSLIETQPGQVSLDQEIVRLNQIALHYQALARGLGRHFSLLSLAATEGKR